MKTKRRVVDAVATAARRLSPQPCVAAPPRVPPALVGMQMCVRCLRAISGLRLTRARTVSFTNNCETT
jgi:hypothetical protein